MILPFLSIFYLAVLHIFFFFFNGISVKKYLNRLFIEGLSGMALGLFSTLIFGTILSQIAGFTHGKTAIYLDFIANIAKTITGAGIGVGVASKYKESPLVTVSAAVAGMVGAFPMLYELAGTESFMFTLGVPGEPLGAFVAAYIAIEVGHMISGKTQIDILVTPFVSILSGSLTGIFIGPYITRFIKWIGSVVNVNVEKSPIIGGIIVAILMGMILTLPISSAAIGISMGYRCATLYQEYGDEVSVVFPSEGSGWDVEANCLVAKNEINPCAYTFLDWAISDEAMQAYSKEYPITGIGVINDIPEGYSQDPMSNLIDLDLVKAAKDRDNIIDKFTPFLAGKSEE